MKINAFFTNRLKTPFFNHVWSWGAYNKRTNQVFLRANRLHVDEYSDGKTWVIVYNPDSRASPGHAERRRHLEAITNGAEGYAILVDFNDKEKITSFDDETVLRIGNITEEDGLIYAEVLGEHAVDDVVGVPSTKSQLVADIREIIGARLPETTRQAMVDARVGQGAFRTSVLRLWDYKCAVTGVVSLEVIRASHIKPWKECDNRERLDPYNGLPLVASLDALFDKGLVAFDRNGVLHVSPSLCIEDRDRLSLANRRLSTRPAKATASYLKFHWEHVFQR